MDALEKVALVKSAVATLSNGERLLEDLAEPNLPDELRQRLPAAQAHAEVRMREVSGALEARRRGIEGSLNALLRSRRSAIHRMQAFLSVVDEVTALAAPRSACKKGCNHCCHIPVGVTALEARVIGAAIGVEPASCEDAPLPSSRSYGYDQPCPFLVEGQCGVYEHRPFSCRVHFNMDRDELLCRLLPGITVPVPLADMRLLQTLYVQLSEGEEVADVRDFFPHGKLKSDRRNRVPAKHSKAVTPPMPSTDLGAP